MSLISKEHLGLTLQTIRKLLSGKADKTDIVQSDWSQNDKTALDYINNRPFYTSDPQEIIVAQEAALIATEETGLGLLYLNKLPVENQKYKVNYNGTEYSCIAKKDGAAFIMGNLAMFPYGDDKTDTGEPFFIEVWDPAAGPWSTRTTESIEGLVYVSSDIDITTITMSITTIEIIDYKIDKKYLPELPEGAYVGKKTTEGGEIFNNASSAALQAHAEGLSTCASGENQHVQGKFNIEDSSSTYAHIVGNGTSTVKRSNAHTLDWNGVGWFQSGLQVGGAAQDGENVGYVPAVPAGVQVGQIIVVKSVDENGKPTEWGCVDTQKINAGKDYIVLSDIATGMSYKIQMQNGNIISSLAGSLDDFTYTIAFDGTYQINGWKQTFYGEPSTEMIVPDGVTL